MKINLAQQIILSDIKRNYDNLPEKEKERVDKTLSRRKQTMQSVTEKDGKVSSKDVALAKIPPRLRLKEIRGKHVPRAARRPD